MRKKKTRKIEETYIVQFDVVGVGPARFEDVHRVRPTSHWSRKEITEVIPHAELHLDLTSRCIPDLRPRELNHVAPERHEQKAKDEPRSHSYLGQALKRF